MKRLFTIAALASMLATVGCTKSYDEQTIAAVQPCLAMGRSIDECVYGYRQYASSHNNNTSNWLSSFAAGAAGSVIANQFLNNQRAGTVGYQAQQPGYTQPQAPIATATQNFESKLAPTTPAPVAAIKPAPALNTKVLIANQEVQPLFAPTKVVAPTTSVAPAAKSSSLFNFGSSTTSTSKPASTSTFKPSTSTFKSAGAAFKSSSIKTFSSKR